MIGVKYTPIFKTLGDTSDLQRKISPKSTSINTPQRYVLFVTVIIDNIGNACYPLATDEQYNNILLFLNNLFLLSRKRLRCPR